VKAKDTNGNEVVDGPYYFNTLPELIAPPPVSDFKGLFDQTSRTINLFWSNPNISDFNNIKLLRSTFTYPSVSDSSTEIFKGDTESYVDYDISENENYYYSIFVKDDQGLYSSGVISSVSTTIFETVEPSEEPTPTITEPTPTTTEPIDEPDQPITTTPELTTTPPKQIEEKEPKPTTTEREILEEPEDEEAFEEVKPVETPPVPEDTQPVSTKEGMETDNITVYSFVNQNIEKGVEAAKIGVQRISGEIKKKIKSIKEDIFDKSGKIREEVYKQLSKRKKEKVNKVLEESLPPKFSTSSIGDIQPLTIESEKAKKEGVDWYAFTGSKALVSIPNNSFKKEVDGVTVSLGSNGYILNFNEETNNYQGIINIPEQKGKYEVLIRVFYKDGTFEDVKKTALVDPYGYVYREKYGEFSLTNPLNIFDKKKVAVRNAVVTLYTKNKVGEWIKWPARLYNQQNPQTTNKDGKYTFIVPSGEYYLEVEYKNHTTKTDVFKVKEDVLNKNIKVTTDYPVNKKVLFIILTILLSTGGGIWIFRQISNISNRLNREN
jgi:hypothetical protein